MSTLHSVLEGLNVHSPFTWIFVDEAARLAANSFVIGDVHKIAYQQADHSVWILTGINPVVWMPMGGSGSSGGGGNTLTNLIINGNFSNGTAGWAAESPATIAASNGQLVISRNGASFNAEMCYQSIAVVPSALYVLTIEILSGNYGYSILLEESGLEKQITSRSDIPGPFKVSCNFVPMAASIKLILKATESAFASIVVDNVGIYKIGDIL